MNEELEARITELEQELKIIKNPQFYLCEEDEISYFCCNHCNFNSRLFKDRDEHAQSCVERKIFLKGGE